MSRPHEFDKAFQRAVIAQIARTEQAENADPQRGRGPRAAFARRTSQVWLRGFRNIRNPVNRQWRRDYRTHGHATHHNLRGKHNNITKPTPGSL
jgi:hypothetical protein